MAEIVLKSSYIRTLTAKPKQDYPIHMYSVSDKPTESNNPIELIEVEHALERTHRPCTEGMAAVNLSEGCHYRCLCCPQKLTHAKDEVVRLRYNLPSILRRELESRRRRDALPAGILFNTASDSFQPIEALQELAAESMRVTLEAGCELHFVTRGLVPDSFGTLFKKHRGQVHAQVSLISMDENLSSLYEPCSAPPQDRIDSIRKLIKWGVEVQGRLDPLIPFLSDTVGHLEEMVRYLYSAGVRRTNASYLVLRSHMLEHFKESLPLAHYHLIKGSFQGQTWRKVGVQQSSKLLPDRTRTKGYQRLIHIGNRLGMEINICRCQNAHRGGSCFMPAQKKPAKASAGQGQLELFAE